MQNALDVSGFNIQTSSLLLPFLFVNLTAFFAASFQVEGSANVDERGKSNIRQLCKQSVEDSGRKGWLGGDGLVRLIEG